MLVPLFGLQLLLTIYRPDVAVHGARHYEYLTIAVTNSQANNAQNSYPPLLSFLYFGVRCGGTVGRAVFRLLRRRFWGPATRCTDGGEICREGVGWSTSPRQICARRQGAKKSIVFLSVTLLHVTFNPDWGGWVGTGAGPQSWKIGKNCGFRRFVGVFLFFLLYFSPLPLFFSISSISLSFPSFSRPFFLLPFRPLFTHFPSLPLFPSLLSSAVFSMPCSFSFFSPLFSSPFHPFPFSLSNGGIRMLPVLQRQWSPLKFSSFVHFSVCPSRFWTTKCANATWTPTRWSTETILVSSDKGMFVNVHSHSTLPLRRWWSQCGMMWWRHSSNELYSSTAYTTFTIVHEKNAKIQKTRIGFSFTFMTGRWLM